MKPTWDVYFLNIAQVVSTRSPDTETQVGAVIVDEHNRILSTGYNGFPPGCCDEALPCTRPDKYPYMLHAELNAISVSQQSLRGATLYSTHQPCLECSKAIMAAGIRRVVYGTPYPNKDQSIIDLLMSQCYIKVERCTTPEPKYTVRFMNCQNIWETSDGCIRPDIQG